MEVILAGAEWKERILESANRIFGQDPEKGGFAALMPEIYGESGNCSENHFLVLEKGRIVAMALVEPVCFVCGKERLSGVGVGTVGVAEEERGRGHMKLLMHTIREWMERERYSFAVLSGQRQRYAYWGYEPAGIRCEAFFSGPSVRHALTEKATRGIEKRMSLEPLEAGSREEELSWKLYDSQEVRLERRKESFAAHLRSGRCQPFCIRAEEEFAGYLTASFRGKVRIVEIQLTKKALFPAALKLFCQQKAPEGFLLDLPPFGEWAGMAERLSESLLIRSGHQYYIADPCRMLEFFLKVKQKQTGLAEGSWDFETEEGVFRAWVQAGQVQVGRSPGGAAGSAPAPWKTDKEGEWIRKLFGPYAPISGSLPGIPEGWLPLPVFLPEIDAV